MSVSLIVFGRAPVEGAVKTRLIPELGARLANRLHVALFEHVLDAALQSGLPLTVALDGPPDAVPRGERLRDAGARVVRQVGGDLGSRMLAAMQSEHDAGRFPLLVGTDCPGIDAAYLLGAADALVRDTPCVVIGPAEDGGYGLIGLNCPGVGELADGLFHGIPWGTSVVRSQTTSRARDAGLNVHLQAPVWDVDWPQDVRRLAREYPLLAQQAGIGAS